MRYVFDVDIIRLTRSLPRLSSESSVALNVLAFKSARFIGVICLNGGVVAMLDLKEYAPHGRVSTGLLVYYEGLTVWGLSRQRYWTKTEDGTVTGLIGIGGGQEPGESLIQAVKREALEEAGADIKVHGRTPTVWAYEDGRSETRDLLPLLDVGEPSPILIWQMDIPWIDDYGEPWKMQYVTAVYLAEFLAEPKPMAENPGLVFLSEAQLLSLLDGPRLISEMVSEGARLKAASRADFTADPLAGSNDSTPDGRIVIPDDTVVQLHGSALYLAQHWGQLALLG